MYELINIKMPNCNIDKKAYLDLINIYSINKDSVVLNEFQYEYFQSNKIYFEKYFDTYNKENIKILRIIIEQQIKSSLNHHINIAIIGGGNLYELYAIAKLAREYPDYYFNVKVIDLIFWFGNYFEVNEENNIDYVNSLNNIDFVKGDYFEILKDHSPLLDKKYSLFFGRCLLFGERFFRSKMYKNANDFYRRAVISLLLPYNKNIIVNVLSCALWNHCPTKDDEDKCISLTGRSNLCTEIHDFKLKEEINKVFKTENYCSGYIYHYFIINNYDDNRVKELKKVYDIEYYWNEFNTSFNYQGCDDQLEQIRKQPKTNGGIVFRENGNEIEYCENGVFKSWNDLSQETKIKIRKLKEKE